MRVRYRLDIADGIKGGHVFYEMRPKFAKYTYKRYLCGKIRVMEGNERYPIGQQDFRTLREGGALYIDKTAYVEKIAKSLSQYYFLARPRRFGKSLFLSTLRYFFE